MCWKMILACCRVTGWKLIPFLVFPTLLCLLCTSVPHLTIIHLLWSTDSSRINFASNYVNFLKKFVVFYQHWLQRLTCVYFLFPFYSLNWLHCLCRWNWNPNLCRVSEVNECNESVMKWPWIYCTLTAVSSKIELGQDKRCSHYAVFF